MSETQVYPLKNKVRIVTAASLFDGHDASINIMRRILQASGAEVIHLGHDRSAEEVVNCAIQEDAHAIAITSYQGGHLEYFKYVFDLLKDKGRSNIRIFGGGGGVILPDEIKELESYGITKIYSPDDGRRMGLQGMINDLLSRCDYPLGNDVTDSTSDLSKQDYNLIARLISCAENFPEDFSKIKHIYTTDYSCPVLGITGTGGAGKSSLIDELVRRFITDFPEKKLAIISVDPSRRKSGGALLGDRIRMNSINHPNVFMRSLATRQTNLALSKHVGVSLTILKAFQFDLIILETSGIGQSDTEITEYSDVSLYVMTPEYGASTQLEKIDMLDFADVIAINKFDKKGAEDALRDVKKQFRRNHNLWTEEEDKIPVVGTIASQFNDRGMNQLYKLIIDKVNKKSNSQFYSTISLQTASSEKTFLIPPSRTRYLAEIAEKNKQYSSWVEEQSELARKLFALKQILNFLNEQEKTSVEVRTHLEEQLKDLEKKIDKECLEILLKWDEVKEAYKKDTLTYKVRGKDIERKAFFESLSHIRIPKIAVPPFEEWGEVLKWVLKENFPGKFPYTAGVFPLKREEEDPTRMFAGEGGPERTNRRFHYLSRNSEAKRLSTAFDSVTLYGRDPDLRPDIYGKIGNSGVSVCCLNDAKKLYSGFNLADPKTSVSMTINGPSAMLTAFFMNAAIDQQCELYIRQNGLSDLVASKIQSYYSGKGIIMTEYQGNIPKENDRLGLMLLGITGDQVLEKEVYEKIKANTLSQVRGTVQADILKEDQAQNTCIFSTEFALRLMGDMQEYFIQENVRNFYSVSISGYHISEAGANPITQLALTLSNGFTYVEYYLRRGMDINKFAPNFSFFFSNGLDPEYAVIGRVARRIWAKAMKFVYGADERAQMLKYHIQTSGRSLHAQEIDFNDIRTTLQALYAIYDNCNSLHTNAFDEAITTPTEASVRRAMAIQLIINKELGLARNENPLQGSFIIEELTDLVEEAVLIEFERINERGGVLGAMETMYQRSRIQEESMYYETLKHSGELPIIGVNTFLSSQGSPTIIPGEVIRATKEEKEYQVKMVKQLHSVFEKESSMVLDLLQKAASSNQSTFNVMMEAAKYCSLGQITQALFEVGGQYRRNM